ncbi:hypothetical protein [Spirosoma sp.]|uniref:hypothetical protein n=1 Tax=Spirosoma sp. TaxID=1899569 RepID=UPI002604E9BE|nr:hypothetical protein [Spirosoma sp.]MCX6216473.1 hypothetical protein [Spirosoma sp.]
MTDMTFAGGNNIAGGYKLRCVPVVGVQSLPTPATSGPMNAPPLTLKSGFTWINIYGTEQTKDYNEGESETDNGPLWAVSTSLFLPGDSADQRRTLLQMSRHTFIVECQDNVGLWRRLGTLTEGLSFAYKFTIDAQAGGQRGALLTFSGNLTQIPPLLTGQ